MEVKREQEEIIPGESGRSILDELFHHGKGNVAGGEGIHSDIMDGNDGPIEFGADGEEVR